MKVLFAGTLFLSSGLLFLVQPLFGKVVLPLVGSTPAAWTTCMLFFQGALLVGYALAHAVRMPPLAHAACAVLPLFAFSLVLAPGNVPPPGENPSAWLLLVLATHLGAPFVLLSMSAPVLQRWMPGNPYALYAASNAGSLIALLAYPLLLEPTVSLSGQARGFQFAYGVFVFLLFACAVVVRRWPAAAGVISESAPRRDAVVSENTDQRTTWRMTRKWVALAFVPSSLLLGVTTYVSTDIAPMPLLWVVPLALYLLSFIIVFARGARSGPPSAGLLTAYVVASLLLFFMAVSAVAAAPALVFAHLGFLFLGALLFHGELARTRPPGSELTRFYLALAVGGALGGAFHAAAPLLFRSVTEYPLTMVFALWILPRGPKLAVASEWERKQTFLRAMGVDPARVAELEPRPTPRPRRQRWLDIVVPAIATGWATVAAMTFTSASGGARALVILAAPSVAAALASVARPRRLALALGGILLVTNVGPGVFGKTVFQSRSFFGVLRVQDTPPAAGEPALRSLVHGTIIHGQQLLDPARKRQPTSYYHQDGPFGEVAAWLAAHRGSGAHVAVVGLGTGVLATFAKPGDTLTFYELDADVARLAQDPRYFTWLNDTPANVRVVLGDARLTLSQSTEQYDLLVVDAFSSDAIPTHLLTREAMVLYRDRLRPHGILVFHISSRWVKLAPPLGALAGDGGWTGFVGRDATGDPPLRVPSTWVALARSPVDLGNIAIDARWSPLPRGGRVWTDDFAPLLEALEL